MKRKKVTEMTSDELVDRFTTIAIERDDALLGNEISRFNRLFDQKIDVVNELKSRPGDQRRLLLKLFTHPNVQVRLNAAKATLAIAYNVAYAQLQAIADSREYPQAGDAGMSLNGLDDGTYKPT
jgi:hypothetical protein